MRFNKDAISNVVLGLMVALAAICAGLVIYPHFGHAAASNSPAISQVQDWRNFADGASEGEREGPENAKVTIIEFADLQCPFCAKTEGELEQILRENPGQVALVFRNFPLESHPHSGAAAHAGECAALQTRFPEFRQIVYSNQDEIGIESWAGFAERAGVPSLKKYISCLASDSVTAQILTDLQAGHRLGVTGTPTLLVNGIEMQGYDGGKGTLKRVVAQLLSGNTRILPQGANNR